jgi:hypothetical protein
MVLQRLSNKCLVILSSEYLCTDVILVNRYIATSLTKLSFVRVNYRKLSVKVQQVVFQNSYLENELTKLPELWVEQSLEHLLK